MPVSVGLFAHVDAGKTTLSEQLLLKGGLLRRAGRVDEGSAFMDHDAIERERGITIYAEQAEFEHGGRSFGLIDTPGHVDFSGEAERSMWACDCAVLVVSAIDGIQSHTQTLRKLLTASAVPTVVFLNKTDRDNARPEEALRKMSEKWGITPVVFKEGFDLSSEELREELAYSDEELFSIYEDGADENTFLRAASHAARQGRFLPVVMGSALFGRGVDELLKVISWMMPEKEPDAEEPVSAKVYKVLHDSTGGRLCCIKVLSGTVKPRMMIACPSDDGSVMQKISMLSSSAGGKLKNLTEAGPGRLCVVSGLEGVMPGDIIGDGCVKGSDARLMPLLSAEVIPADGVTNRKVWEIFSILTDEEPTLKAEKQGETVNVHIMGRVQLEVLAEQVKRRFGAEISFGEARVLYRETIEAPVIGSGHYEPLRHYAEAHFRLEPAQPGSGITFSSEYPTDLLLPSWQRLIRTHVFEKQHRGVLTGSPVTDIHVVLISGRSHLKHTEGGDFREATYRAIRHGLMNARSRLLEPWYGFEASVGPELTGRLISDIRKMGGECMPDGFDPGVVRGCCPVRTMAEYPVELASYSRGMGMLDLWFDSYRPVEKQDEIIASIGYDPERDTENTADSVFCSHGAGFHVPWREASGMMHMDLRGITGIKE